MDEGGLLGEVAVGVKADLTALLSGFSDGKRAADQFDTAVGSKAAGAAKRLEAAAGSTASSLDKVTTSSAKVTSQTEKQVQATVKNIQSNTQLKAAFDRIVPVYDKMLVAQAKYEQELEDIARLEKAGAIGAVNASLYRSRAAKAYDQAARSARGLGTAATFATRPLRALEVALGAVTAGAIIAGIKRMGDSAQEIRNLSTELGVTTDDLQVYQFAAQSAGVTNSELETGFRNLSKSIGEAATGSEADIKAMRLLGYSLQEIKSGAVTVGEALPRIADLLDRIPEPARKAALLTKLFGESGQRLAAMLAGGSKSIDVLRKAAQDMGYVLSSDDLQSADEVANKIEMVQTALSRNVTRAVAQNADAIIGLADALGRLTNQILKFLSSNPQAALAIIGALAGARFGPAGAVIGAAGGAALGENMQQSASDSNNNLAFRRRQMRAAQATYHATQGRDVGGTNLGFMTLRRTEGANSGSASGGTAATARAEWIRQIRLLQSAMAGKAAPKPGAGGKLSPEEEKLFAGMNAPKGSSGKSGADLAKQAEAERVREERRKEAFEREMSSAEDSQLKAMIDLSTSIEEQRDLQLEIVDRQKASYDARLRRDVSEGQLTQAEADQLQKQNALNAQLERDIIQREASDKILAERVDTERANLNNEQDLLGAQADLAKSSGERRELALRMLDVQFELERLQQEEVLASQTATAAQKDIAQKRLDMLGEMKGYAIKSAERQTAGPWESYVNSIPQTAGEISDALEEIQVKGIDGLINGLAEAGLSWKKMGAAAKQVLADITTEMVKMQLRAALFGGSGTMMGGGGGLLGGLLKIGGSLLGGALGGGLDTGSLGIASSFGSGGSIFGSIPMTDLGSLAPVFHKGTDSVGGTSGHMRRVPSSTFINAPRYHKGLGLGPRERAAIIEDGEQIIPRGGRTGDRYQFGDIIVQGAMDDRTARKTGRQIWAGLQGDIAKTAKYGFKKQ